MSGFEAYKIISDIEKRVDEIKALYHNLKSDISLMSQVQINSLIRRILYRLSKIDITELDENLQELSGFAIYDEAENKIKDIKNTIAEIKKYIYSIEEESEEDEEEINVPENKKVSLIRDKYRFLQKLIDSSENTEAIIKDAKRLDNIIARVNFEDLPEGDYDEMVNIKNEISKLIKTLEGVALSEKYGSYIKNPLIDLIANIYTLGNREKAENKAATILNFIENPQNIYMFEPAIKRIIAKKMTPKEFRLFHDSIMSMMKGEKKFESFESYKERHEYFYFL